jgi:hypothetical protein
VYFMKADICEYPTIGKEYVINFLDMRDRA